MAERFGGPVWHASGRGKNRHASRRIALDGLAGVGDASRFANEYDGEDPGIVHVQRMLSDKEREAFGVPEPFDIRGTEEERRRIAAVYAEAPYLRGRV